MNSEIDIVDQFAKALDHEDYAVAESLLDPGCVYRCRGEIFRGPTAIIASYRGNGDAAKSFDSIEYESSVSEEAHGRFRIEFRDHISHAGKSFLFCCEQIVELNDHFRIAGIEHVDLPDQVAALEQFREAAGIPAKDHGGQA